MRTVMGGGNERKPPEIIGNIHLVSTRFRHRDWTETNENRWRYAGAPQAKCCARSVFNRLLCPDAFNNALTRKRREQAAAFEALVARSPRPVRISP